MKLSFSLNSKSNPKPRFNLEEGKSNDTTTHQYVTEFDPSKPIDDNRNKIIIPPLANSWKRTNKMKNLELLTKAKPTDDPESRFELEAAPTTAEVGDQGFKYGLTLRKKEDEEDGDSVMVEDGVVVTSSIENLMLKKYKEDMENLPEDRGFDEFIDCPVEGYGEALLSGYGWKKGQGIGKNAKEDVQVVQYVRRAGREGLGYEPEINDKKNGRPLLVAPKGKDGRTRHVVGIDEKLVAAEPKGMFVGKVVRVVNGRHVGLKGKVVKVLDDSESTRVVLLLLRSETEVTVREVEVAELGSLEEENCLEKLHEAKTRAPKDDKRYDDRRRDSSSNGSRERRDLGSSDSRETKKRKTGETRKAAKHDDSELSQRGKERDEPFWLISHIRVRVVCKKFKGGKLYLKKGEIVDVGGRNVCDIAMDETKEVIQGVKQNILETVIPKRGGPVLILYGRHKGVFGNLVERDTEKETGVVRDADNHELLNVRLEQIAEYIGDPSHLGY
ncbi:hypothetical protein MKW94_006865 [Papaver nudicaule]|uniref:G-patch domain-containing protein n=1 Tax=Papaver nudicaule TaxID=74823 RepID=A0AA41S060_PAPNU|nr:hypothetical protein [Papaver nudicaule]